MVSTFSPRANMQKPPWWPLRPTYGYGVKGQKKGSGKVRVIAMTQLYLVLCFLFLILTWWQIMQEVVNSSPFSNNAFVKIGCGWIPLDKEFTANCLIELVQNSRSWSRLRWLSMDRQGYSSPCGCISPSLIVFSLNGMSWVIVVSEHL